MIIFCKQLKSSIFFVILLIVSPLLTHASVVITGNRIIYSASATEKVVQFSNPDNVPYMVQIWTDVNNPQSTPEVADGPFVATPQIFRIDPKEGQIVRLIYTGKTPLPTDRESVFYFNFVQIPALKQTDVEKNKLAILISSRLKIFYRPSSLGTPDKITDYLQFNIVNQSLEIMNASSFHVSLTKVSIVDNKGNIMDIPNVSMIAPKSKKLWSLPSLTQKKNLLVRYFLVNDYGVAVQHEYKLK